jgi:hypothetical protein
MLAAVTAPTQLPAPDFDRVAPYPEAIRLRDATKAGDWPAVAAYFRQVVDPQEHYFATIVVAEAAAPGFLDQVVAREPSTLANTLLAIKLVIDGWAIRTTARAKDVSREQFDAFHDHVRRAERLLVDVTAREPDNTSAWTERLVTARALGLGQAEARRRYERLAKTAPHHYAAQRAMVQQLCPKWGGSFDAVHEFALGCARTSPPGSISAAVVAEGYIEHTLEVDDTEHDSYIAQPHVQQEILDAARHSVLHPAFEPTYGWVTAHSTFAMAFSLAGNYAAAAPHFRALGNFASEAPWYDLRDPAESFVRHRDRALGKG